MINKDKLALSRLVKHAHQAGANGVDWVDYEPHPYYEDFETALEKRDQAAQTLADILPDLREMIEARENVRAAKAEATATYHAAPGSMSDRMAYDTLHHAKNVLSDITANNITKIADRIGGDDG